MRARALLVAALVLAASAAAVAPFVGAESASVAIASPAEGAVVSGVVTVAGTAFDPSGVTHVHLSIDGGPFRPVENLTGETEAAWSTTLDTTSRTNGPHTLTARARGAGGSSVTATVNVTFENPVRLDLRVASFSGETGIGGRTTLTAGVANDGNAPVAGAVAAFDYAYAGEWRAIGSAAFNVSEFGKATVELEWAALALVGEFDVRVTLDPANDVPEQNEANNAATATAAFWSDAVAGADAREPEVPGAPTPPLPSATHEVLIVGAEQAATHAPRVLVVRAGDTVVWRNLDANGAAHSATRSVLGDFFFDSGPIPAGGESEPVTFLEPGTYDYLCTLHAETMRHNVVHVV